MVKQDIKLYSFPYNKYYIKQVEYRIGIDFEKARSKPMIFLIYINLICQALSAMQQIQLTETAKRSNNVVKLSIGFGSMAVLENEYDTIYAGYINVGTPAQLQKVVFDTGSDMMWIASTTCVGECGSWSPKFNMSASSSYISLSKNYQIIYMKGSASGVLGKDFVQFQNFKVFSRFMVAENASSFSVEHMDGIMGLGNFLDHPTIFQLGVSSGQLISSAFAFQLGMRMLGEPSYFYYNISEMDFKGAVYVNAMKTNRWAIPLFGVLVKDINLDIYQVGLDTGTSGIILPNNSYLKLEKLYFQNLCEENKPSLNQTVSTGIRKCGCQLPKYPTLTFLSNEINIVLTPQMYIYRTYHSRSCYLGIFPSTIKFAILGANFMQHHIVIFNRKDNKLGFVRNDKEIIAFVKNFIIIDMVMVIQCLLVACTMLIACYHQTSSQLKVPLIAQEMEMNGNNKQEPIHEIYA